MNPRLAVRRHPLVSAALLLAVTLTACTGNSTGPYPDTSSPTTAEGSPTVPAREAVLKRLAADLRTTIDGLAEPLAAQTTHRYLTGDSAGICHMGDTEDGTQQWDYSLNLRTSVADTAPFVRDAAKTLAAQGWSIREEPAKEGEVILTAQKDGAVIGLTGGRNEVQALLFQGFTACVSKDGAIDTSPRN